jgi:putative membrane protein
MRLWMTIVGFALIISMPANLRADDKTSKPDRPSDDKASKSDDKSSKSDKASDNKSGRSDDKSSKSDKASDNKSDKSDRSSDDKKMTDTRFVDHAYTSGQNEVMLGRMAAERARNEDVRKFAMQMVEDHSKNNNELTILVSDLRIAVPDRPLPDQDKDLQKLHANDVKDFDRDYMDHMVKAHEDAVKLFEQGSKELKNDRLKDYATKTLPTLKHHLTMAKEVRDKVSKSK